MEPDTIGWQRITWELVNHSLWGNWLNVQVRNQQLWRGIQSWEGYCWVWDLCVWVLLNAYIWELSEAGRQWIFYGYLQGFRLWWQREGLNEREGTCLHVVEDEIKIFVVFSFYYVQQSNNVFVAWVKTGLPLSYWRNMTSRKVLWASVALWNASNTCLNTLIPSSEPRLASTSGQQPSRLFRRRPSQASLRFHIFSGCGAQFPQSSRI